jgi:hypothetical protein
MKILPEMEAQRASLSPSSLENLLSGATQVHSLSDDEAAERLREAKNTPLPTESYGDYISKLTPYMGHLQSLRRVTITSKPAEFVLLTCIRQAQALFPDTNSCTRAQNAVTRYRRN